MRWIRHNFGYKLLALMMAISLKGYIHSQEGSNLTAFDDLVEVRNVSSGLLPRLPREVVRVTVEGPANRLTGITSSDVESWVDMKGLKPGRHRLSVRCELRRDAEVLACRVNPGIIPVEVEERATRTMPIKVSVSGAPPLGFEFSRPKAFPSTATISGPRRDVMAVKQLVASVATTGQTVENDLNRSVRILPLDSRGGPVANVEVTPREARIIAPLSLEPARKRLIIDPIFGGTPATGYKITGLHVEPSEVQARGEATLLTNLSAVHTRPIDLEGLNSSRTLRNIPLETIPGIHLEPERVNVTIEVELLQGPPVRPPSSAPPSPPAVGPTLNAPENAPTEEANTNG